MAPGGPSEAFWSHLLAWVRKWLQEALLEPGRGNGRGHPSEAPRFIFWPERRTGEKATRERRTSERRANDART
eukprot:4072002-Karenia_brevis.AAC.1